MGRHARRYAVRGGMSAASRALAELPAWSEDCLFLECLDQAIVGPAQAQPVTVFFHGGSNRAGYSQRDPAGFRFRPGGLRVVSANYRLQSLGFLAHPGAY